jgi:glycosyltransferase involved in cell wall biosynthesis
MTDVSPTLSIIVVSYQSAATIERCLAALAPQRSDDVEILVVDSGGDATAAIVARDFPEVRLVRCVTRHAPGAARNVGIAAARGALIGFVDSDCIAAPDWATRVLDAHRDPAPVIGGVIDLAPPRTALGTALYLCEFNQWLPGTPAGPVVDIPTCCLSLKRWAFDRYGPYRTEGYSSDTAFNWRLARAGHPPRLDPSIRIAQMMQPTWRGFVRKQLMHGRAFARMRVEEEHFSTVKRWTFAVAAPVLPLLLGARLLRRVRARTQDGLPIVRSAPLVFLGLCLWSAGELAGYVRPR